MTVPAVSHVDVYGEPCRVWTKGTGPRIGFLAGFGGLPKWIPFLDHLAENFEVVVPSIPGFPGGLGHTNCDTHLDWVMAIGDLVRGAGLLGGAPLIGSGPGGALAADMAAFWPSEISHLALISPWGLFAEDDPMTDPWARRPHEVGPLMLETPDHWNELKAEPEGVNSVEWPIEQARALEASARIFWPLGNTGLANRLGHITCPTLLIRGDADRVIPASYMETFREGIKGETTVKEITGSGHLAELDQPQAVADAIREFI
ncbi:MAG: alpha/beta fold hydrolase [Alphaproteobacteria bacterium]|nr:alpha/beta fold hydrolase [Alphaproteobacteria bacterium]